MDLKEYFLSSDEPPSSDRSKLSAYMKEILELSKAGYSSRQIAKGLKAIGIGISHQSVSAQIKKHSSTFGNEEQKTNIVSALSDTSSLELAGLVGKAKNEVSQKSQIDKEDFNRFVTMTNAKQINKKQGE